MRAIPAADHLLFPRDAVTIVGYVLKAMIATNVFSPRPLRPAYTIQINTEPTKAGIEWTLSRIPLHPPQRSTGLSA